MISLKLIFECKLSHLHIIDDSALSTLKIAYDKYDHIKYA